MCDRRKYTTEDRAKQVAWLMAVNQKVRVSTIYCKLCRAFHLKRG